jgi:hypothetical protein
VFDAAPLAMWYEENFERESWREANRLRRSVLLDLASRYEAGEQFPTYKADGNPFGDAPMTAVMGAMVELEWRGYVRTHHLHPQHIIATIESSGYDVARDEPELARSFPTTASEDEQAHAPVVADVLPDLITSCAQAASRSSMDKRSSRSWARGQGLPGGRLGERSRRLLRRCRERAQAPTRRA